MKRTASAIWSGNLKEGTGTLSSQSGVLSHTPYSFHTRFEQEPGTNPEELIGTAHAGCYSMALSMILGLAGTPPERIETEATITLDREDNAFAVTTSHLEVKAIVPGIDEASFQAAAEKAKISCPISKLMNAKITINAKLI